MRVASNIYRLSHRFYDEYPNPPFDEILKKEERPYSCLVIELCNYKICLPFRSNMNHKYGYRFRSSARSRKSRSGIDYTKMIIITESTYIDISQQPIIDKDEFNELRIHISEIVSEATDFLNDYISYMTGLSTISQEEFTRRYKNSTLKYFHKELGIKT